MNAAPLPEHPVLPPDYVQPAVTSVDSGLIWIFRIKFTLILFLHLFLISPPFIIHCFFFSLFILIILPLCTYKFRYYRGGIPDLA